MKRETKEFMFNIILIQCFHYLSSKGVGKEFEIKLNLNKRLYVMIGLFAMTIFVYIIDGFNLQFNGLLIDPEQKSSIICFVLFLFSASNFCFVSAFTTKQNNRANPWKQK